MAKSKQIRFGRFTYDGDQRILFDGRKLVHLSPKVSETLEILIAAEGRIVSKAEFMAALWPDTYVEESNLTQNIFVLRRALGVMATGEPYIETIPRRGYRLCPPLESVDGEQIPSESAPSLPASQPAAAAELPVLSPRAGGVHAAWTSKRLWATVALVFAAGCVALGSLPLHIAVTGSKRLTDDGIAKNLGPFPVALLSDGRNLYFTEQQDNHSLLAHVPISGGEVRASEAPFPGAEIVDLSAQQRAMLIGSVWHTEGDGPLLSMPLVGGKPLRIGELVGHDASWSPTGSRIVLAQGKLLKIAHADGTDARTLVSASGVVCLPRWSPDERVIRFTVSQDGNDIQLWEVHPDGSGLHQLFAGSGMSEQVCCGNWTADGRYYFFIKGGPTRNSVGVLPSQGNWWGLRAPEPVQLEIGLADQWRAPLPSADGSRLWLVGSHMRGELLRVDAQTREFKPFLNGISAEGVSFSADGKSVVYTAYPEGTLWRAHADGSARLQLTKPPMLARFPHWSPDGKNILFLGGEEGTAWRLYLLEVETGQVRPLLSNDVSQGVGTWSPDGSRIAFGHMLDYGARRNVRLTVDLYDVRQQRATTLRGSEGLWTARLSPDGRYLTAVTQDNRVLRLYDTATGVWSDLADVGVNDVVWSSDSRFIFFDTFFGSKPLLYRIRVADHTLQVWASLQGLHRGGFYGPWLGISPAGEPLLLRDSSIEEIYELSLGMFR